MLNVPEIESGKSNRLVEVSFLVWLLTLPFGAKIGAFSLGFFSVYPNLIVSLILFALVIRTINQWKRILQVFFGLLGLWLVFAICYPFFGNIDFNSDWKFDVHSLGMQWMFTGIIFGSYYSLGLTKFRKMLKNGISYFLGILITFGIFEYYTGIHFTGTYTDSLLEQDMVNWIFYSPLFIYDNSNDFLVYLIGLALLFVSFSSQDRENKWKSVALFILVFLFAETASSRIGILICVVLLTFQLFRIAYEHFRREYLVRILLFTLVGAVLITLLLSKNKLFIGSKYSNGDYLRTGEYVDFPKSEPSEGYSSDFVRKNLFFNGVDFIKEKPVLGIGPGQFRYRHKEHLIKNETGTIVGPHNYLVEVVTQYGIMGWCYLFMLGYLFFSQVKNCIRNREGIWKVVVWPMLALMMLMPSSFLYMDINWFIVPVLALFSTDLLKVSEQDNE